MRAAFAFNDFVAVRDYARTTAIVLQDDVVNDLDAQIQSTECDFDGMLGHMELKPSQQMINIMHWALAQLGLSIMDFEDDLEARYDNVEHDLHLHGWLAND